MDNSENDNLNVDEFAGYGPDAAFIRSIVTPAPEDYETDLIKFIKQSGIIPEGQIKKEGDWISSYDDNGKLEHSGIANAGAIELKYKLKYVKCRDKKTIEALNDKQEILFLDETNNIPNNDDSSDNEYTGITYKSFMDKTYKLQDPDTIVLPCSYINIHFDHPCWQEHVTFRIPAEDEIKGFTRHEIMKRALERFHLIYYIFRNYNVEEGKMNSENPSCLFHPVLWSDEYTTNGLHSLIYNKKHDYWTFDLMKDA